MTEMVERVARMIYDADGKYGGQFATSPWDSAPQHVRAHFEGFARAAIRAMREPTDGQAPLCDGEIHNLWQVMIDAALSEAPE